MTLNWRLYEAKSGQATQLVDLIGQQAVLLPSEEDGLMVVCCSRGQQGVSMTIEEMSPAVMTFARLRDRPI